MERAERGVRLARRVAAIVGLAGGLAVGSPLVAPVAWAASAPNATCVGTLPPGTYNNVTVPKNATCDLDGTNVILGNVVAQAGSILRIHGTHIGGNLQDQHGANLVVNGATIGGSVQVAHVTGGAGIADTIVGGDGQVFNNTAGIFTISSNHFGGNLQVNNNTGDVTVEGNVIENNLDCQNNQPPPASGVNIAKHYGGQCQD